MRTRAVVLTVLACLFALAAPSETHGQLNSENFAQLGFNFSPPGARSTALGGAFVPLADDATAAESNPAGLTVLLYPQISFEFKAVEYTRTLTEEAGGGPGGRDFTDQRAFPSFVSAVYPTESFAVAAFRHELVDYHSTTVGVGYARPSGGYLYPYTAVLDLQVDNMGGAAAFSAGPLSVGVSGGISTVAMDVDFPRYRVANFEPGFITNRVLVAEETASGIFVTGGLLLRMGEMATLGAVYKMRPKFTDIPWRKVDVNGDPFPATDSTLDMNVPDAFGAGVSVRPTELFTLAVSAEMIRYSQIPDGQTLAFETDRYGNPYDPADYVADDGLDFHAGAELILIVGTSPIGLRAGVSSLAPSNTYYTGPDDLEQDLWGTEPGDRTLAFSAGFGTVISQLVQLDAGGVMGEHRKEIVVSAVLLLGAL